MKTKFYSTINAACQSFVVTICAGAIMLVPAAVQAQNLFESDAGSGNIYEFTSNGTRTTFASGFSHPSGLAFNGSGQLFVADNSGNITKITPGGEKSTFASGLITPEGLAFDSAGNLFVSDFGSGTIYEFAPDGTRSTFATGLKYTYGLTFNNAGNLFVANSGLNPNGGGGIIEITPDGMKSTFVHMSTPGGLVFKEAGDLFVSDNQNGTIIKFTPGGTGSLFASSLTFPEGLAFNSAGNLLVTDTGAGYIREYAPDGSHSTFAGGPLAPLFSPWGLAFQPVPEPSIFGLLTISVSTLLVRRRNMAA